MKKYLYIIIGLIALSPFSVFAVDCTSFTYSDWGICTVDTQTRTVLTSEPLNCTGGSPVVSQSCTPIPTTINEYTGPNLDEWLLMNGVFLFLLSFIAWGIIFKPGTDLLR